MIIVDSKGTARVTAPASPSTSFDFLGDALRTLMIEGEPWFIAQDVCRCIGLTLKGGAARHLQGLRTEQKRTLQKYAAMRDLNINSVEVGKLFTGNVAQLSLINESGLYRLILRANGKPKAVAFQKWVEDEVLPSIRKTGGYLLNEEARKTAHADTRDEMPLPAAFTAALTEALAPIRADLAASLAETLELRKLLMAAGAIPDAGAMWTPKGGSPVLISSMNTQHLVNTLNAFNGTGKFTDSIRQMRMELERRRVNVESETEKRREAREAAAAEKKEAKRIADLKKAKEQESKAQALIAKLTK